MTGNIIRGYIYFGIAKSYCTAEFFNDNEKINVNWSTVEHDQISIKSAKKTILHRHLIDEANPEILAVLKNKVHIFEKYNNPHLDGVDHFLIVELLNEFYFIEPDIWRQIHESWSADIIF